MMVQMLITEWERVCEQFKPIGLKEKKKGIKQFAIPLNPNQSYPRFHLHVMKKRKVWIEIWVHLDWKRHDQWEVRNEQLIEFVEKLKQI